jgi:hypothetical protein
MQSPDRGGHRRPDPAEVRRPHARGSGRAAPRRAGQGHGLRGGRAGHGLTGHQPQTDPRPETRGGSGLPGERIGGIAALGLMPDPLRPRQSHPDLRRGGGRGRLAQRPPSAVPKGSRLLRVWRHSPAGRGRLFRDLRLAGRRIVSPGHPLPRLPGQESRSVARILVRQIPFRTRGHPCPSFVAGKPRAWHRHHARAQRQGRERNDALPHLSARAPVAAPPFRPQRGAGQPNATAGAAAPGPAPVARLPVRHVRATSQTGHPQHVRRGCLCLAGLLPAFQQHREFGDVAG